jgi:hypothetical protein
MERSPQVANPRFRQQTLNSPFATAFAELISGMEMKDYHCGRDRTIALRHRFEMQQSMQMAKWARYPLE